MKTVLKLELVFIENGGHLLTKVLINGKKAMLVVDTGASTTVFDKTEITKYVKEKMVVSKGHNSTGLGTSSMKSQTSFIKKIKFGTLTVADYEAVLLDLSHVHAAYASLGLPPFVGVLGSDILMEFDAIIDFKKLTLTLNHTPAKK